MSSKFWSRKTAVEVFSFLSRQWRRCRGVVFLIALSMVVGTVADLLLPFFSGRLVDAIAGAKASRSYALHNAEIAVASMSVLGLVLIAARYVAFTNLARLSVNTMSNIVAETFWRVQRLSTDWQINNFAGSTLQRISKGMRAIDVMNDILLLSLLPSLVILIGSSVALGMRWLSMGLIALLASVAYVTASILLSLDYVAPSSRLSNRQDTRLGAALADSITCNTVVKSFGAEEWEQDRLHWMLDKWRSRALRRSLVATRSAGLQLGILVLLRALVASYATLLWWRGLATAGDVTFILSTYFLVHGYLREIGQHVANLQMTMNQLEETVSLQSQPLGIVDRPHAPSLRVAKGSIEFSRVSFRYSPELPELFTNLSVRIDPGERVGLVGHSGAGKSTFVKLLHRLYEVNGGYILIDGQDISLVGQQSLRAQLGLVAQEPILFHRSLAENIAYGRPGASHDEIEEAACLANAHGFIQAQPRGYATLVGERGVKLSGGERQRIALARAFLANAPVMLLDEATSNLDSESEAAIQEAMERLMAGRTCIVIAHRLSTVRLLDRILVFDHGRIVEEGSHGDLIRKPGGSYLRLFEKQALSFTSGLA